MLSQWIDGTAMEITAVETAQGDFIKFVSNLLQREWQRDE
jgi:hypothetical protein